MIRVIVRRNDRHGVGFMRRRMLRQFHCALGIGRADVNNHGHAGSGLIKSNGGGFLPFLHGHRRPLAGRAEDKQTLNACADMKIHQLSHDLFVYPRSLVEGRDYRQQDSANHDFLLSAVSCKRATSYRLIPH